MGMMNWLGTQARGLDSRVVGLAERNAQGSLGAAQEAIAAELLRRRGEVVEGTRNAQSLAPQVADLLSYAQPGGDVNVEQLKTQNALRALLAQGGPMPDLGRKSGLDSLQAMLEMQGVAPSGGTPTAGPELAALADAFAQAKVARSPGVAGGFHNALAAVSDAVATNPWARAGAYSAATAGGAAGLAAMTPAAQQLLSLAGFLDSGETLEEKAQNRLA